MESGMISAIKKWDKKVSDTSKIKKVHLPAGIDTMLKWAPALSIFVLDAIGAKTKNNLRQHLLLAAAGEGLLNAVLVPVKHGVHRVRPNHSANKKSFPSGHTATSFLGAEMLRHEWEQGNKLLSCSGYVVAVAAGFMRVNKNKHWPSDIVAGAVLGLAAARFTYWALKRLTKNMK